MTIYTGTADANGNFTINIGSALTSGEIVQVTAQKDGQSKSINIQAPSEPYLPPSSGGVEDMVIHTRIKPYPKLDPNTYAYTGAFDAKDGNLYSQVKTLTFLNLTDGDLDMSFAFQNWNASELVLPTNITRFPAHCFKFWQQITHYTLSNNYSVIGAGGFYSWKNLSNLTLNDGLLEIEDRAFGECSKLTNITIPNSVKIVGEGVFEFCTSLKSVTFGSGVEEFGAFMFRGASILDELICLATTPPQIAEGDSSGDNYWFNLTEPPTVIKVPAASVDSYKTAVGWNSWASRIIAIQE